MTERATESIQVNAAPSVLYRVVTDFEHYPEWVSDLKRIEVWKRTRVDDRLRWSFVRRPSVGPPPTRCTTTTTALPDSLAWHQTHGDLTSTLNGQYRFVPQGEGTLLAYELEVDLLVPIPSFVKARAAYRIQHQALRELKARAESLS